MHLAAAALLGAAAGAGAAQVLVRSWDSRASIVFAEPPLDTFTPGAHPILTSMQLLRSQSLARDVARRTGGQASRERRAREYLRRIHAAVEDGSNVVHIWYAGHSAEEARSVLATALQVFEQRLLADRRTETARRVAQLAAHIESAEQAQRVIQDLLVDYRLRQGLFSAGLSLTREQAAVQSLLAVRDSLLQEQTVLQTALATSAPAAAAALLARAPPLSVNAAAYLARRFTLDSLSAGPQARTAAHPDVNRARIAHDRAADALQLALAARLRVLELELTALDQRIQAANSRLRALLQPEAHEQRLRARGNAIARLLAELRAEYQHATIAAAMITPAFSVLDPPGTPREPTRWPWWWTGLAGAALGALLVALAGIPGRLRRFTVTDAAALQRALDRPSLGSIPGDLDWKTSSDVFQALRANLRLRPGTPPRLVLVTSALPGEGKTTAAIGLARALAAAGTPTVLVDADWRDPALHQWLGVARSPGFADYLAGSGELHCVRAHDLQVVTAGSPQPDPAGLLGNARVPELLARLAGPDACVVIDAPPALCAAETAILATCCDTVLLVVQARTTALHAVLDARQRLAQVGAGISCTILNHHRAPRPPAPFYFPAQSRHWGWHPACRA